MCGRYVSKEEAAIERAFNLTRGGGNPFGARYNAAPTDLLPIIRNHPKRGRELTLLRWGLIPSWAKDASIGAKMINARAETLAEKPAFRSAFQRRRCLVPMAGFYEWQKTPAGRMPHYVDLLNADLFAVAGLYEWWPGKEGVQPIESYTIVTTQANERLAKLHDRMPVILHAQDYDAWLDPKNEDTEGLNAFLVPYPAEETRVCLVSQRVNNVKNDDASLIQAV
jgi:putative SOS response-associated peptidase YedK